MMKPLNSSQPTSDDTIGVLLRIEGTPEDVVVSLLSSGTCNVEGLRRHCANGQDTTAKELGLGNRNLLDGFPGKVREVFIKMGIISTPGTHIRFVGVSTVLTNPLLSHQFTFLLLSTLLPSTHHLPYYPSTTSGHGSSSNHLQQHSTALANPLTSYQLTLLLPSTFLLPSMHSIVYPVQQAAMAQAATTFSNTGVNPMRPNMQNPGGMGPLPMYEETKEGGSWSSPACCVPITSPSEGRSAHLCARSLSTQLVNTLEHMLATHN